MPKDENEKELSYSMKQVMNGDEPVLYVVHDEEGDWCFSGTTIPNSTDGVLIHKEHLIKQDPSIKEVMDMKIGWEATRKNKTDLWTTTER